MIRRVLLIILGVFFIIVIGTLLFYEFVPKSQPTPVPPASAPAQSPN